MFPRKIRTIAKTKTAAEYITRILRTVAEGLMFIRSKTKLIIPYEKQRDRTAPKMQRTVLSVMGL